MGLKTVGGVAKVWNLKRKEKQKEKQINIGRCRGEHRPGEVDATAGGGGCCYFTQRSQVRPPPER